MTTNRITFIAELKDRLTGPTKSAQRAVENLADATERAGHTAAAGLGKAEKAAQSHGKKASDAHGKAGKAAEGSATRSTKAAGRMEAAFQKIDGRAGRMASALNRHSGAGATAVERAAGRMGRALSGVDANGAASRFGRGMDRMASHAAGAASRIEHAMGRAGQAIGLAVGALGTASLIGGGTRLTDIEGANVKLEVMGFDDATKSSIMGTVEQSVIGTPFGLGEAAKVGTQLLGSGVGTDLLADRLQTTVNVASLYGNGDIGDISTVLSQIQAKGRLMGEEALQLNERGMPVYDWIAEAQGIDKSEVPDLISSGGVSSDDFWEAMAPRVAGGSQLMGETFKGVFANLRTAFSRGGAQFLTPLMDPLKDLMRSVTQVVKDAEPFFTALGQRVAPGIAAAAEHAPKLAAALEPLGGPLLAAAGSFADLLPEIVTGLTAWFTVLGMILPPIISFASYLADLAGPFLPVLIPLLFAAGTAFTTWRVLKFISPLLGGVGKGLGFLGKLLMNHPLLRLATLLYAGIKALGWLYDNSELARKGFDWLSSTVSGVVEFFDDLGSKIDSLVKEKLPALYDALNVWKDNPLTKFSEAFSNAGKDMGGGVRSFLGTGEHWGSGEGALRFLHGEGSGADLPHHALGGWTRSGAHAAILGEEGREFVVPHQASEQLAAIPGALGAISKGQVPVRPVAVPVSVGASAPAAGGSGAVSIGALQVYTNATDGAEFARQFARHFPGHFQAATARQALTKELTYSTLTERGAR